MDGRANSRNKTEFSNFSGVLKTGRKQTFYKVIVVMWLRLLCFFPLRINLN